MASQSFGHSVLTYVQKASSIFPVVKWALSLYWQCPFILVCFAFMVQSQKLLMWPQMLFVTRPYQLLYFPFVFFFKLKTQILYNYLQILQHAVFDYAIPSFGNTFTSFSTCLILLNPQNRAQCPIEAWLVADEVRVSCLSYVLQLSLLCFIITFITT